MKKLCISIALLLVLSVGCIASDSEAAYATFEPIIDGIIDEIWEKSPKQEGTYNDAGAITEYANGYTKVLWSEDYLYFLAVVEDSTPITSNTSTTNSVDLWLSEKNTKNEDFAGDSGDWHLTITSLGNTSYYIGNPDVYNVIEFFAVESDTGYVIEVKVPYLSDVKPDKGTVIGYNVSFNDDIDDDATRDTFTSWQSYDGRPYWSKTIALNELEFLEPVYPEVVADEIEIDSAVVEAPKTEVSTVVPVAAQTNDTVIYMCMTLILASAMIVITKNKKIPKSN